MALTTKRGEDNKLKAPSLGARRGLVTPPRVVGDAEGR